MRPATVLEEQEVPVSQAGRVRQGRTCFLVTRDKQGLPGVHLLYLRDVGLTIISPLYWRKHSRGDSSENEPSEVEIRPKSQGGWMERTC